jgi:hypothetical protein
MEEKEVQCWRRKENSNLEITRRNRATSSNNIHRVDVHLDHELHIEGKGGSVTTSRLQ